MVDTATGGCCIAADRQNPSMSLKWMNVGMYPPIGGSGGPVGGGCVGIGGGGGGVGGICGGRCGRGVDGGGGSGGAAGVFTVIVPAMNFLHVSEDKKNHLFIYQSQCSESADLKTMIVL